jgi:uncharacterized metal-binding protein
MVAMRYPEGDDYFLLVDGCPIDCNNRTLEPS